MKVNTRGTLQLVQEKGNREMNDKDFLDQDLNIGLYDDRSPNSIRNETDNPKSHLDSLLFDGWY